MQLGEQQERREVMGLPVLMLIHQMTRVMKEVLLEEPEEEAAEPDMQEQTLELVAEEAAKEEAAEVQDISGELTMSEPEEEAAELVQ